MSVLVDTAGIDPRRRAGLLRDQLSYASSEHEVRFLESDGPVHARLEHWQLSPEVAVMRQESSGISHVRTERHARREGPERVAFVVHDGGGGVYEHAGVSHPLQRGGLYVTDMITPFRYVRPGDGVARILQIELAAAGVTPEQVRSASRALGSSSLAGLFRHYVLGLVEDAGSLAGNVVAAPVAATTLQLAQCLLLDAGSAAAAAREDAMQALLLERIRLYVQVNFARYDLSADLVAYEHHISTRYLFKLWSSQPQSFAQMVMTTRLEAARRMLTDHPRLSVAAAAHRCGFRNVSHFVRRYRLAYGETPAQAARISAM